MSCYHWTDRLVDAVGTSFYLLHFTGDTMTDDETIKTEQTIENETVENEENLSLKMLKDLMDEKLTDMSNKLSDLQKKYDEDTKSLKDELEVKKKEVDDQKKLTANLLLNTSGKTREEIDFNNIEFDDVDWSEQSKKYLDEMDKRIFGSL